MSRRNNHHHNSNSSHRDCTPSLHRTVSSHSSASSFPLAVCGRIALPNLVDARIRDRTRALVCKPGKCKRLAHLQYFVSVHLVLEHWVARCVRWHSIRRSKRLYCPSQYQFPPHFLCAAKAEKGIRLRRTSAGMSSSKCRVSSGLRSCGLNGASIRWILSQSIPLNQTCACGG